VEEALGRSDLEVIDAGVPRGHKAVVVKIPIFIAVGAKPLAGFVVGLVGKSDGDTVSGEGPKLFDEAIVGFALPFA
jgi:hypothetical protein